MTPDRFFSLLLTLQSRETTTTADLAAQVGVSVRTVLRDLQWLQEAGFPLLIRRGRRGGVTLLPGGMLDTSRLTSSERDHLALYGLDDMQREQLGAAADTRRAHQKVRSTLRLPNTDVLPLSAVVTTDNRPWFSRDIEGLPPAALVGDLRRGVRLRICYRRSEDIEATWRVRMFMPNRMSWVSICSLLRLGSCERNYVADAPSRRLSNDRPRRVLTGYD